MERKGHGATAPTRQPGAGNGKSGRTMDPRVRRLIRLLAEQAARDTLAASRHNRAVVPPADEGSSDD